MSRPDGRKPLVAGNWKMHNNHFQAIALTQKLAFSLTGKVVIAPSGPTG